MTERLSHESQQQAEARAEEVGRQRTPPGLEFAAAEDALRFDAAQTPVPPELRARVLRAVEEESAQRPWWRRWLSR